MKKLNIFKLILVVAFMVLQGCSTTYDRITPLLGDGQKIVYKNNDKTIAGLTSEKYNTVSLVPKNEMVISGKNGYFTLTIDNKSLNDIQFSINNISANSYSSDINEVRVLEVFGREKSIENEKSSQAIKSFWSGLGYLVTPLSELEAHHKKTKISKEKGKENLKVLESLVSEKAVTILPGEKMSGVIKIQLPEVTEVRRNIAFILNVDKEEHKFIFTQKEIDNAR